MKTHAQPLVSVLTPVYNGKEFLAECIERVLAQAYSNWEYIIVNNCSKDRTLEIALEYAKRIAASVYMTTKSFLRSLRITIMFSR